MKFSTITAAVASAASVASALSPIEIKGNAFYAKGNNTRFYIRGVDYQPGGSSQLADPLADDDGCKRDVPYFQKLGVNTIRVYSVDNSQSHDTCMKLLDDAGIYVLLDVNTPKQSINRAEPGPSYNAAYLQNVFAIIDAFKGYDNTFGFFAANEVINSADGANTTEAAPYVKAVVRDMKAYIKAQAKRFIPVGYSAADVETSRWQQMEYFNCGDDAERIDMFGMNDYSWCGDSSFQKSGYQQNVQKYQGYSIPMFLSEFGCNKVPQGQGRPFTEISAIYSSEMSSVYSGGLVYEYSQESSNYGLVQISGSNVKTLKDFDTLQTQFSKATDPSGDGGANTNANNASSCPSYDSEAWLVKNDTVPPLPSGAEDYLKHGAGKGLGTAAPDTQAGATSQPPAGSATANPGSGSESGGSSGSASGSSSSSTSTGKKKSAAGAVQVPKIMSTQWIVPVGLVGASFVFGGLSVLM